MNPLWVVTTYYGAGILKSTDGGASWVRLGADVFNGLGISKIEINPQNTNILYVSLALSAVSGPATPQRGVFKIDGWWPNLAMDDWMR